MSYSRQAARLLRPSTRTRRRISAQFSMSVYTHRPHGEGPGWGQRNLHRGPQAVSEAMGATFSGRPSAAGPRYVFSAAVTQQQEIRYAWNYEISGGQVQAAPCYYEPSGESIA